MSRLFLCSSQLNQWPRAVLAKFQFTIYPITFSVGNADEWKKLFKPCAAQRLFLPVRRLPPPPPPLYLPLAVHNVINRCGWGEERGGGRNGTNPLRIHLICL